MNIRHAYSKEDPSPDERLLWGALADDVDALALLRIGYEGSPAAQDALDDAYNQGYEEGFNVALNRENAA